MQTISAVDLKERVDTWVIKEIIYNGQAADGGSHGFLITTEEKSSLGFIFANPNYSTKEELEKKHQVIYILNSGWFFDIVSSSKQEKKLISALRRYKSSIGDEQIRKKVAIDEILKVIVTRKTVFEDGCDFALLVADLK